MPAYVSKEGKTFGAISKKKKSDYERETLLSKRKGKTVSSFTRTCPPTSKWSVRNTTVE
jgi:hypothetical protein